MRWVILLSAFIIACNPVAPDAGNTPEPTATPEPPLAPTLVLLTKESCIATLQQYYPAEKWKDLRARIGIFRTPSGIHFGEQACEDEMYFQGVPIEVRLLMYRIDARRAESDFANLKRQLSSVDSEVSRLETCIRLGGCY